MLRAVPGGGAVVVEGRAPSAQRSQLVFGCRPERGGGGGSSRHCLSAADCGWQGEMGVSCVSRTLPLGLFIVL